MSRKPVKGGATAGSSKRRRPAHPWFTGCASNWWKRVSRLVLSRKQRATPAVAPIFDGEKEAKLIALACSKPPKGRARWTLRLLERKGGGAQDRRARQRLNIGRVLTTYGPPRLQGGFAEIAGLISLLQRIPPRGTASGQDGDARAPVLIKVSASSAVF